MIDANALKEEILKTVNVNDIGRGDFWEGMAQELQWCVDLIDNAPTVERPQGEWITQPHSMIMKCSLCGQEENAKDVGTINYDKHFCSFCGAKMENA